MSTGLCNTTLLVMLGVLTALLSLSAGEALLSTALATPTTPTAPSTTLDPDYGFLVNAVTLVVKQEVVVKHDPIYMGLFAISTVTAWGVFRHPQTEFLPMRHSSNENFSPVSPSFRL